MPAPANDTGPATSKEIVAAVVKVDAIDLPNALVRSTLPIWKTSSRVPTEVLNGILRF